MSTGKSGILRGFEIMGNYLKLFEIIWNYVGKLVLISEIMGTLFGIIPSGCFVRKQFVLLKEFLELEVHGFL